MASFSLFKNAILLLAVLNVLLEPSVAEEHVVHDAYPRHNASWTDLTLEGSKLFTDIELHMQLRPADCKPDDLPQEGETESDNCPGTADDNILLSIRSSGKGPGFSEEKYEENIMFNKTTFHPYTRIRMSNVKEKWVKNYYWEETGVRRQKITPANSRENKQSQNTWTKRSESFYLYPKEADECSTISDPSLLLYILSTLESDVQQESIKICMFGKKQLHRLTIRQGQSSQLKASYTKSSPSQEVYVKGQRSPFVFSIGVETFAPGDGKQEEFSLFGLHEDIRIYIDPEYHLPLRVSGKNNSIGKLVLNLTKVTENTPGL